MKIDLKTHVKSSFINIYESTPILVFSPRCINLIGERTDFNGGYVFPATIDKGIICAVARNELKICRIYAIDVDENYEFGIEKLEPLPEVGWQN